MRLSHKHVMSWKLRESRLSSHTENEFMRWREQKENLCGKKKRSVVISVITFLDQTLLPCQLQVLQIRAARSPFWVSVMWIFLFSQSHKKN